jgi:hypothetical protein
MIIKKIKEAKQEAKTFVRVSDEYNILNRFRYWTASKLLNIGRYACLYQKKKYLNKVELFIVWPSSSVSSCGYKSEKMQA